MSVTPAASLINFDSSSRFLKEEEHWQLWTNAKQALTTIGGGKYYRRLGVSQRATQAEIRKAYLDLAFKHHPGPCHELILHVHIHTNAMQSINA